MNRKSPKFYHYPVLFLTFSLLLGSIVLLFWTYSIIWPSQLSIAYAQKVVLFLGYHLITVIFGSLFFGVIVHELLHGLTFAYFSPNKYKDIRFGVNALFVYCHCKAALLRNHYLLSALMPAVLLGILPIGLGLAMGNLYLFLFGIFQIFSSVFDVYIAIRLVRVPKYVLVQDYSDRVGYQLIYPSHAVLTP